MSAGDVLRAELARHKSGEKGSKYGEMIQHIFDTGSILPGYVTVELLLQEMRTRYAHNQALSAPPTLFLIDGFPRTLDNVQEFEKQIAPCQHMLFIDCEEQVMIDRLLMRAQLHPGARSDDRIDIIANRLKGYRDETMPVLQYFEKVYEREGEGETQGSPINSKPAHTDGVRRVVHMIDGNGSTDVVYQNVRRAFLHCVKDMNIT